LKFGQQKQLPAPEARDLHWIALGTEKVADNDFNRHKTFALTMITRKRYHGIKNGTALHENVDK
jgi:hypothetical protein